MGATNWLSVEHYLRDNNRSMQLLVLNQWLPFLHHTYSPSELATGSYLAVHSYPYKVKKLMLNSLISSSNDLVHDYSIAIQRMHSSFIIIVLLQLCTDCVITTYMEFYTCPYMCLHVRTCVCTVCRCVCLLSLHSSYQL